MNPVELTDDKLTAIIYHDKRKGTYTVSLDNAVGPIVSANDINEVKDKFIEAFKLASAVRNFRYFTQAVKADDQNKEKLTKNMRENNPEIEYLETEISSSLC